MHEVIVIYYIKKSSIPVTCHVSSLFPVVYFIFKNFQPTTEFSQTWKKYTEIRCTKKCIARRTIKACVPIAGWAAH